MVRRVKEKANVPLVVRLTTYNRLEKERQDDETFDKVITRLLNEKNKPSVFDRFRKKEQK